MKVRAIGASDISCLYDTRQELSTRAGHRPQRADGGKRRLRIPAFRQHLRRRVSRLSQSRDRELDDLLDEFWGLLQSVLSRRALVISWFYLFRLSFGVGFWESWAVSLASYVPMVVPVGRKYIEQFGIIIFRDLLIPGRPHAPQQLFRKRSSS
jgi:hypothetical protein